MSLILPRRGFLRSLAALPLVGGSVTLVGQPSAVAEPVTDELRNRYLGWLAREFTEALVEREGIGAERAEAERVALGLSSDPGSAERWRNHKRNGFRYMTDAGGLGYECPPVPSTPPSTRAALVLAAVGCDWHLATTGRLSR